MIIRSKSWIIIIIIDYYFLILRLANLIISPRLDLGVPTLLDTLRYVIAESESYLESFLPLQQEL